MLIIIVFNPAKETEKVLQTVICIQVHLRKLEYGEKVNFFL